MTTWKSEEYVIKELATGDTLKLRTYTIQGKYKGPHIHIQSSVHGAELQGNAVILQLMEILNSTDLRGSITFVPLANPYATNNKHGTYTYGRYNPITGDNWNRNYKDIIAENKTELKSFVNKNKNLPWSEIRENYKIKLQEIYQSYLDDLIDQKKLSENNKLNLMLQSLAIKADGILDLHTGPVATRYLYAAEYEEDVAKFLNFKHVLVIPNEFGGAMDEASFIPWIHLRDALYNEGRNDIVIDIDSFTLEFGSEEMFSMNSASKDVESIINYLKYKGLIDGTIHKINSKKCLLKNYNTIYSPCGGLVDYHFSPGESFKSGDTLASFYNFKKLVPENPITSTIEKVKASEDGIIINRCPSSSVHQGMELYQVMTKVSDL